LRAFIEEFYMQQNTIDHIFPVWREKANFILAVALTNADVPKEWKWEQIWARQIEENIFEICCIPFFAYGLALGDLVDTHTVEGKDYVIKSLVKSSNNKTIRVWMLDLDNKDSVVESITKLGCLVEFRSENSKLISVAALTDSSAKEIRSYLSKMELGGFLNYEDSNFNSDRNIR
jgi:Domain of unknown function (DUF4265)